MKIGKPKPVKSLLLQGFKFKYNYSNTMIIRSCLFNSLWHLWFMPKSKRGRPVGSFSGFPTIRDGKVTATYKKWLSMCARCRDPKRKYYGGAGVKVCERWSGRGGFTRFVEDMGEVPPGLTLERRDNLKGYEPSNCRWATWQEQYANRRKGGNPIDPLSLRQRAKAAGLPYHAVYLRIKRLGWTEDKALSTPLQWPGSYVRIEGRRYGRRPNL